MVACDIPSLTVPGRFLLDTGFLVDALLSDQRYHAECGDALIELASVGSQVVYSGLLEIELLEAVYRVVLREGYGSKWKQARPDGRARRRVSRIASGAMESWAVIEDVMAGERVEPSDVAADAPELMRRYGLRSYDAIHVATAMQTETRAIYTLDTEFARVPANQLTLYTVSPKVARMRRLRA